MISISDLAESVIAIEGEDSALTRAVKCNDASAAVELLEDDAERIGDAIALAATCGCDEALLAMVHSPHAGTDAIVRGLSICIRKGGKSSTIQRLMCLDAEAGMLAVGLGVHEGRGDVVKQAIMLANGCVTLRTWQAASKTCPGIPAPLTVPISNSDVEMLSLLLAVGLDPNAADYHTMTPLMHAAASSQLNAVKMLVCYGADPTLEDVAGNTAIFWAIQGAVHTGVNTCLAYFLANGCRATARDVLAALKHRLAPVVRVLLVAGTRIDATPEGEACVIMACQDPPLLEMVLAHRRFTAPLDTAVVTAAASCQTDALEMLLKDPRCPPYQTLHDAMVNGAKQGHADVVDVLMTKGVAPSTRVLEAAVRGTHARSSRCDPDEEQAVLDMVRRLSDGRRESLAVDLAPPLTAAVDRGYASVVKLLLGYGAKPTRGTMHKAVNRGDEEVCALLIEAGGSPSDLLAAAIYGANSTRSGTERILRLALSAGAKVTPADFFQALRPRVSPRAIECMLSIHPMLVDARTDGRTPLHVCVSMGLWDACAILLDYGADPHACVEGFANVTAFHLAIDKTIFGKLVRWVTMRRQKAHRTP